MAWEGIKSSSTSRFSKKKGFFRSHLLLHLYLVNTAVPIVLYKFSSISTHIVCALTEVLALRR